MVYTSLLKLSVGLKGWGVRLLNNSKFLMFMTHALVRIAREELRYWRDFDIPDLFRELGVQYHPTLMLGQHPVVRLLDPKVQTAHFTEHASPEEQARNESALDVMVRGTVRYSRTFVVEIGGEFGCGLFAGEDMAEGMFIGEYAGVLTWKGFTPVMLRGGLFRGESSSPYDMDYMMPDFDATLDRGSDFTALLMPGHIPEPSRLMIDAHLAGGETRFINHLGENEKFYRQDGSVIDGPNVEVVQGCHQGYFRKWLFAKQPIKRGDELRLYYSDGFQRNRNPVSKLFSVCKDGLVELYKVNNAPELVTLEP